MLTDYVKQIALKGIRPAESKTCTRTFCQNPQYSLTTEGQIFNQILNRVGGSTKIFL